MENRMQVEFSALSQNESFARVCVGAFAAQLDPTLEEIADLKTAVSEAVTNAIVHAYPGRAGVVRLAVRLLPGAVEAEVADDGVGIADVPQALKPFFTTVAGEERSGMGFTVMQTFMDEVRVDSAPGRGTRVTMRKDLRGGQA